MSKFGDWLKNLFGFSVGGSSSSDNNNHNGDTLTLPASNKPFGWDVPVIDDGSEPQSGFGVNFGYNTDSGDSSGIGSFLQSLTQLVPAFLNRLTAEHLTGAEREANQFSAEQAQIDRDFQERMADTQYQRGVADMRAAGVNPALAYSQGGAAAPSGQAASSVQPQSSAFNMSDLMDLFRLRPQIDLMRQQGFAQVQNAEANRISAEAASKNADSQRMDAETRRFDAETRRFEYENVHMPLALNQIRVGDTVVKLNDKQVGKIEKEIEQLSEDITLTQLHEIATALDIAWRGQTWDDSKKLLSSQIAKNSAEAAYQFAISKNAGEEYKKLVNERKWSDIYYKYWSDPKHSDRGVNIQMLQGTNIAGAGIAYLQAFGDNLGNNDPGARHVAPQDVEGLGR